MIGRFGRFVENFGTAVTGRSPHCQGDRYERSQDWDRLGRAGWLGLRPGVMLAMAAYSLLEQFDGRAEVVVVRAEL